MNIKRWRDRVVSLALIGAAIYFGGPFVMQQFGMLEGWSGENMGTDLSAAECDKIERDIRMALGKVKLLDADGQLASESCTSTRNCVDMKGKYKLMLSKIENGKINCPWWEEYEYKLERVLSELDDRKK